MLSFFWIYIFFFWYFCFTLNCLWSILGSTFWGFSNFIFNFITNQIDSCFADFWIAFFEAVLSICGQFFIMIKTFLPYLLLKFLLIFLAISLPIFLGKEKNLLLFTRLQIFSLLVELNSNYFFLILYFN